MMFILGAAGLLILSGLGALCSNRRDKAANYAGAFGAISACVMGLIGLSRFLFDGGSAFFTLPWFIPYGSFSIAVDPLGALFLFPVFILCSLCALYGIGYLEHFYGRKNIGSAWFSFNVLCASMVFVVIARNAVLFLTAWEMMSVSSFFLVMFEGEKKDVQRAGFIYLAATHIGTLFLLVMFILLGNAGGSLDFSCMNLSAGGIMQSVIFLLAVVGFGTKAGFMPLHIWLPEAHPAAPSHVSAVMSGVMIKMGIYGLLRVLIFLDTPCLWWGWLLIAIGVISGIFGILFALTQQDLKRLLAYSSIENIGVITIGLGAGIVGICLGSSFLAVCGFLGALLHVINHAFFKGLLFLGAGSIYHVTGTRQVNAMGGLLKKMPVTGLCFFVGSAAICALPPFNGFISEFLIYFGSLKSIFGGGDIVFVSLITIICLSFIGSLAVVCFTNVFGVVFLGEARSLCCQASREAGIYMKIPVVVLAGFCFLIGLAAPFILPFFSSVLAEIAGIGAADAALRLPEAVYPLAYIVVISLFFYLCVLLFAAFRRYLLSGRRIEYSCTWDCGYAKGSPRMQYSAASYVQPVADFLKSVANAKKPTVPLKEYFPRNFTYETASPDIFKEFFFRPLFKAVHHAAKKFSWFQHGRLQLYILYIFITLLVLLIWKL